MSAPIPVPGAGSNADVIRDAVQLVMKERHAGRPHSADAAARLLRAELGDLPVIDDSLLAGGSPDVAPTAESKAEVHTALGEAHMLLGNRDLAIREYEAALDGGTSEPRPYALLAIARMPGPGYLDVIASFHSQFRPATYLEIGVESGKSISLARPPTIAVGIDPMPRLDVPLTTETHIFTELSDDFFARAAFAQLLGERKIDLAFLDGDHHFEQALRDFIGLEKLAAPGGIVLIHDTLPLNEITQGPDEFVGFWTGDIWRLGLCLRERRPDLSMFVIAAPPSGLAVVTNLNPASRLLESGYDEIVAHYRSVTYNSVEHEIATRLNVVANDWPEIVERLGARHLNREAESVGFEVGGRGFRSALPSRLADGIQEGTLHTTYRGVTFRKSPLDQGIYTRLIDRQRPRSVIEIGTLAGGSALWFADMLSAHDISEPRVLSIDINPAPAVADGRIQFVQADSKDLARAVTPEMLAGLAHPWLVIDDGSHRFEDIIPALEFFHPHIIGNDYVVVEDGWLIQLSDPMYARYENGPNRAVSWFVRRHSGMYEIDVDLCDLYGFNVTQSPNGWLRRLPDPPPPPVAAPRPQAAAAAGSVGASVASSPGRLWSIRFRLVGRILPNPLFDAAWYLHEYPDIKRWGTMPYLHYRLHGVREQRHPNAYFRGRWYLDRYPDVALTEMDPLDHYLRHGGHEGRDPGPRFSSQRYLADNPDVRESGMNPLLHYLRFGAREDRRLS